MSRGLLHETVINRAGAAQAGATVNVYEPGTTTPIAAVMHDAPTGGAVLTNPLTSDANGTVSAYLDAPQFVTLAVVVGAATTTYDAVAIGDGTGGGGGGGDEILVVDVTLTHAEIMATNGGGSHTLVAAPASPLVIIPDTIDLLRLGSDGAYTGVTNACSIKVNGSRWQVPPGVFDSGAPIFYTGLVNQEWPPNWLTPAEALTFFNGDTLSGGGAGNSLGFHIQYRLREAYAVD